MENIKKQVEELLPWYMHQGMNTQNCWKDSVNDYKQKLWQLSSGEKDIYESLNTFWILWPVFLIKE